MKMSQCELDGSFALVFVFKLSVCLSRFFFVKCHYVFFCGINLIVSIEFLVSSTAHEVHKNYAITAFIA